MKGKTAAFLFAVATLCMIVQTKGDNNINPVVVARAFALKSPEYFNANLYGQALKGETWEKVMMRFTIRKSDFGITSLYINGEEIPLPEAIYSLPLPTSGIIRNVQLDVEAMTKSGDYAGHGFVDREYTTKDDILEVVIKPSEVRQALPIDVSLYGDVDVEIQGLDTYGWGPSDGKFYVYFEPTGDEFHYIVRRRDDGQVISEGSLRPFGDAATANNTYFGFSYAGGVIDASFPDSEGEEWLWMPNLKFNSEVPTESGKNIAGGVLFTDVGNGALEILVRADVWIYVQQATEAGEMPFLELKTETIHSDDEDPWLVQTMAHTVQPFGVGKVVITIFPKGPSLGEPGVQLHRYYGTPDDNNGVPTEK